MRKLNRKRYWTCVILGGIAGLGALDGEAGTRAACAVFALGAFLYFELAEAKDRHHAMVDQLAALETRLMRHGHFGADLADSEL